MRHINFIGETPRKGQVLSDEDIVNIGLVCAAVMTLLALTELYRLTSIMG